MASAFPIASSSSSSSSLPTSPPPPLPPPPAASSLHLKINSHRQAYSRSSSSLSSSLLNEFSHGSMARSTVTHHHILPPPHASTDANAQVGTSKTSGSIRKVSVPLTIEESIDQATSACNQASKDGLKRLQLEILLPLIGATDLDDWPGGIQQQFKAATPVVLSLLKGLTQMQEESFKTYIIDDGDAVGVWESEQVILVLFPNAESLEKVNELADVEDKLLLLVNAQWQSGQVISDFGFGEQRKAREEFVASFSMVYHLKQMRVMGEDVRLLKCYPGKWQVFVVDSNGDSDCIAVEDEKPSYKRLQDVLKSRSGSKASQGWFSRLLGELKFNQDSLKG